MQKNNQIASDENDADNDITPLRLQKILASSYNRLIVINLDVAVADAINTRKTVVAVLV